MLRWINYGENKARPSRGHYIGLMKQIITINEGAMNHGIASDRLRLEEEGMIEED